MAYFFHNTTSVLLNEAPLQLFPSQTVYCGILVSFVTIHHLLASVQRSLWCQSVRDVKLCRCARCTAGGYFGEKLTNRTEQRGKKKEKKRGVTFLARTLLVRSLGFFHARGNHSTVLSFSFHRTIKLRAPPSPG